MEMVELMFKCLQSGKNRTLKVPLHYSLEKLKSCLSCSLFNTPTFASSLHLYLDKDDDELSPLSPDDSLLSLGIMFPAYIYYDVYPSSPQQQQGKSQIKRRSPERDLLKRVILEDLGNDFSDNKLVFAAIHAVFLESGFVAFDSVSGSRISLSDILENQASVTNLTASVSYTLPQLLSSEGDDTESIVLKFHGSRDQGSMFFEDFVDVSGCLANNDKYSGLHELSIDKFIYVPAIRSFWVKVILELWKFVKDGIALPLLMDLCEKTRLNPPPCLISLPADLKLRILELLPCQDIAEVACVCKEMRKLCSNHELWKEKYMSKFGSGTAARATSWTWPFPCASWKVRFGSYFENAKKRRIC